MIQILCSVSNRNGHIFIVGMNQVTASSVNITFVLSLVLKDSITRMVQCIIYIKCPLVSHLYAPAPSFIMLGVKLPCLLPLLLMIFYINLQFLGETIAMNFIYSAVGYTACVGGDKEQRGWRASSASREKVSHVHYSKHNMSCSWIAFLSKANADEEKWYLCPLCDGCFYAHW